MDQLNRITYQCEITKKQSYKKVWDLQRELQSYLINKKKSQNHFIPNFLLLCEHEPVYTLGKSGDLEHLISKSETALPTAPEFFKINRGGDITFHGPGQITGYPIFDMDQFYHDLHRYVRDLEEAVIRCLSVYGIQATRIPGLTGVWIVDGGNMKRKICAIGVHMSRWVSMHGFALNVSTDLRYYQGIIPCGISDEDKTVTSMQIELGHPVDTHDVKKVLKDCFRQVFDLTYL